MFFRELLKFSASDFAPNLAMLIGLRWAGVVAQRCMERV